jgi:NitT/TauT family transport system permease protein
MLIASSPAISAALYPLLVVTQAIPKVALAPILIIALGANEVPRIIVTFLVAFFPLVVGTVAGCWPRRRS